MHQLDNLTNLLHDYWGERSRQGNADRKARISDDVEAVAIPLMLTLAIGALGLFLFRSHSSQR